MKLKAKQEFSWAHRGCEIENYEAGQVIETDDQDLIDVATSEGWAEAIAEDGGDSEDEARTETASKSAPKNKASKSAPKNKASKSAPENK